MSNWLSRYTHWLHTRWPAGTVEKLPDAREDGTTAVPGVRIVGDLTGIPLLKFSAHTGARAVQTIVRETDFTPSRDESDDVLDLAIVGAGVSGIAAALEAKKAGLFCKVFEATQPFSTIVNFPKGKPIYTYPTDMEPAGALKVSATVKEDLLAELEAQREAAGVEVTRAHVTHLERKGGEVRLHHGPNRPVTRARRVIVAIGRTGNYRKLGVPGEPLDKVYNRLYDPKEYAGKQALVVGGGDSALETAIALASCGAQVTLSYRKKEFSRPKPDNLTKIRRLQSDPAAEVAVERPVSERVNTAAGSQIRGDAAPGSLQLLMGSQVRRIEPESVTLETADGTEQTLPNDVVFAMIGREAPLEFFRRSGIAIRGEWRTRTWVGFLLFFAFCVFLYHWKKDKGLPISAWFKEHGWFPFRVPAWFDAMGGSLAVRADTPGNLLHVLRETMGNPGFYYTLAYSVVIVVFGIRRIRRRKTPYVTAQTLVLIAVQCVPLFLLPQILLPWAGQNGWFDGGPLGWVADQLFPQVSYGFGREYWRAYGLILAWPLFIYNFFTDQPLWGWLVIGGLQTFVVIPALVYYWGKGAYCGWICSCGALAETLGDTQRHKMPHGPIWNRVNMVGQVILAIALVMLATRILGWIWPGSFWADFFKGMLSGLPFVNYEWLVDLMLAGTVGLACYFWFSGRVWCRFACPLAALMHVYARFSRFRIFADKAKCISCNVCTSVCHQGIDIMNFANKGLPMQDPQCVRCSACVQQCPTGVLSFGRYDGAGRIVPPRLPASLVQLREESASH